MKLFLATNMRLKLLAVAFAIALWFFVAGQSKTEVGFLVHLGFKGMPADMVMTGVPPDDIEVRVAGPRFFISNLSPAQITAELDLSGAKEGLNTYRLQPKDIITPMGVEVLRLRPGSVDVKLERLVKTELPVKVRLSGQPAEGYRVADVLVFPKTVTLTATQRELGEARAVYTRPVDISGMDSPASVNAQLDTGNLDFRSISAERVEVKLIVKKETRK